MKIRVQISNTLVRNSSGPGLFMRRLKSALRAHPVKFVDRRPHILLSGINYEATPHAKTVFRVDGCYYQKSQLGRNGTIKEGVSRADGVVFQSCFSQEMVCRMLRVKPKAAAVIHNGFDQSIVSTINPMEHSGQIFVASAMWRTTKRPNSIIRGFLEAAIPNSSLVMIGESGASPASNVIYPGILPPEEVFRWYKAASAMIHMSFIDSCPNSVVEALSFGLPVICNNIGGTPEIVGQCGVIVPCDAFYYVPVPSVSDNVPSSLIAAAIRRCLMQPPEVQRPDLDIRATALNYYQFFQRLLAGSMA